MSEKRRDGGRACWLPPAYVFLFAIYPILFLFRMNIVEVAWTRVLAPMALTLALATLIWLGSRLVFRARHKRGLATVLLLFVAQYYKVIHDSLCAGLEALAIPATALVAHVLAGIAMAAILLALGRSRRTFSLAGKALSWIITVLVVWNLAAVGLHYARDARERSARQRQMPGEMRPGSPSANVPDIYCIFLDEFASLETARSVFGHDHSSFAARLRASGFFIAEKSRGLYIWTPEAIAAVLNMEPVAKDANYRALIQENKLTRFLRGLGYAIYDFPYGDLTALEHSRRHFVYPRESASIFFDDFYRTLVELSVLYPLAAHWQANDRAQGEYFRQRILYVFEQLPRLARAQGPKFVLVHLFSPHAPFVFDANGGAVAAVHFTDYSERKYYLEQYRYVSRRVAETVEAILRESARPPVIVLLSDHGYRGSFRKPLLHVVPLEEKKKIFLALHLPTFPSERLDDALPPHQVFRLVLEHYFAFDPFRERNPRQ